MSTQPSPEFLSVKNWRAFQHYGDRNPPWIKLYNSLIEDYSFGALPDTAKAHLVGIWLLASRIDNKIPCDPEWLAKRINATDPVDLNTLVTAGWLVLWQPASEMLAPCKRDATPETEERERERRSPPTPRGSVKARGNGHKAAGAAVDIDSNSKDDLETIFPERVAQ